MLDKFKMFACISFVSVVELGGLLFLTGFSIIHLGAVLVVLFWYSYYLMCGDLHNVVYQGHV